MTDKDQERRLRPATADDAPAIGRLMEASIRGIFPRFYDARQTESTARYFSEADHVLIDEGTYFVIEEGGELIGCGGWSRHPRLPTGTVAGGSGSRVLDPATEAARVRLMFVRPDRVRQGLGSQILDACEAAARADGYRRLGLMATLPGRPLYERHGFTVVEETEIRLPDGVNLATAAMEKTLVDYGV